MHKMLYFFEKTGKSPQRLELRPPDPRVVTPITCYNYFLKGVRSANVITVKKEQK